MTGPRLVLASASPRRADVLRQLGLDPVIRPADVDETYEPDETPSKHVERLARAKADALVVVESDALIIAGDTVVVDGDVVLGKPAGPEEAVEMLLSLSGRSHVVMSGIAIAGAHGVVSRVVETVVRFRELSAEDAARYVATEEPLDKAGAYGIQGLGARFIERIEGCYYNVVGLPLYRLTTLLAAAGFNVDTQSSTDNS